MKKTVSLFAALLLICGLISGCVSNQDNPTTNPSQPIPTEQTEPSQPTQPSDPQLPERLIGIEDVQALTVTVDCTTSFGGTRRITYAIRNLDGVLTFYECNMEAQADVSDPYHYQSLCVVNQSGAQMYSAQGLGQVQFLPVDLSGEYDSPDGYFRCELANLGFDFGEHFSTDGFIRGEDTTCLGRECYVYSFAYTDHQGSAYKAEICVDKQTGLWLRSRREIPGTHDYISLEVRSLEESAGGIPQLPEE